jgi:hypothetical protein
MTRLPCRPCATALSLAAALALLAPGIPAAAQAPPARPGIFLNAAEAAAIRDAAGRYPLLDSSLAAARAQVEQALAGQIEVPPPGEAGGYAHERHKQNYRELHHAGLLFAIT